MQVNTLVAPVSTGSRGPVFGNSSLESAIDYALASMGSGFRNDLCRLTAKAVGLDGPSVAQLGEAVENFHLASLLLDDLPCMDDAMERRGRLATHIVYGESRAILAALALINRSYVGCWNTASRYPRHSAKACRVVNRLMGESGILEGQDRDLNFNEKGGADEVLAIATLKTGCLLELSLVLPAVLGGASFREILFLKRLARYWGKAYQALDDFKDLLMVGEATGKTPFQDKDRNRPNLVHCMGPMRALWKLVTLLESAGRQVDHLVESDPKWQFLADFQGKLTSQREGLLETLQAIA